MAERLGGRMPDEDDNVSEASDATIDHHFGSQGDSETLPPKSGKSVPPIVSPSNLVGNQPYRIFGDYQILREIARGGMGVVYQARQISLNRVVALKMILSGQLASQDDVRRFYIEAESAAGLTHPAIVPIYEIGCYEDQHFFSMGFVDGPSLANVLKDGPLPPKAAAQCLAAVCDAIQYAHEHGVVHRDLKPGNILLATENYTSSQDSTKGRSSSKHETQSTRNHSSGPGAGPRTDKSVATENLLGLARGTNKHYQGEFPYMPKVTDFGLAKQMGGNSELTGTGQVLGTPSYMPPEQADGRVASVGPLSDVYSLGAILYCMLTGRPPFQSANPIDTLMQVIKEPPIAPRQLNPSIPRDLETICLKAIEKSPVKRYASASEMHAELNRFLVGEPIHARPISVIERGSRWLWRHPTVTIIGAVVAMSTGAVIWTTRSANLQLQRERDLAILATKDAKTQRELAQDRLAKAIEAVDQMMVRAASERWANRPELQDERRRVLEDAVAFYSSFGEGSEQDTRVRVEAAKAQFRVSGVYLLLNDMDAGRDAAKKAATVYERLISDFPKDTSYKVAASEVASLLADIDALTGNYEEAQIHYQSATDFAYSACMQEPDSPECKLRSFEALSHQVYFLLALDPAAGSRALEKLSKQSRTFGSQASDGFAERLAFAFAMAVEGAYLLSSNNANMASKRFEEAWAALNQIQDHPPGSTRLAQEFKYTQAIITVQRGLARSITGQSAEEKRQGIDGMYEGIALYDRLLSVNPKAIPFRLQKIQTLRGIAAIYRSLKETDKATEIERNAMDLLTEMARENPNMTWLSGLDAMQQSIKWVESLRTGSVDGFELTAEGLLKNAPPRLRGDIKYNIVCAYALVSSRTEEKAETYAAKAVSMLRELADDGFFKEKARFAHLAIDTDIAPIRDRDDFRAFLESIKK